MNIKAIEKENSKDLINKGEIDWAAEVQNYHKSKKNLEWGSNPIPQIRSQHVIREENSFVNPLTQKICEKSLEKEIEAFESQNIKNALVRSYDKSLQYEQTFDIITLKDKIKHFKNHPNYPKRAKEKEMKLEKLRVDYNILSNKTFDEHHFAKPEQRPKINKNTGKINKEYSVTAKDYDIITGKYVSNHDDKMETNNHIVNLEAAKKFLVRNDYNLIKGEYFLKGKENIYQEQHKIKMQNWGKDYNNRLPLSYQEYFP